ncbi:MAG: CRISPR-associated RAMP protein Csx10 [Symploca sp. SIO1C2]|nr:CRISPR-associated RAMP protein Csx10 [Symploca sp. SIO1C2]
MKEIQLKITALSPLAIGRKKPGSVSEAGDYIPGSVIRGAIASVIIQQSNLQNHDLTATNNDFQSLFLNESAAIFRNAYPAPSDQEAKIKVLPATALTSKTNPGFKPKGYGVFDTLIDRFCAESYGYPYDPNCPQDGGRVEPYKGFYSKQNSKYCPHSVTKRLLTRVGINRRRLTAEEQILYSLEVLNETQEQKPMVYRSSIMVEDNHLAESLEQFLNHNSQNFRLGGAASRGLGKVEIEANSVEPDTDVSSRIKLFNKVLQQRWQKWAELFGNLPREERNYFTLNLQSDTILTENWRRTMVISPEMLQQFTGMNAPLILEVAYSSYDYVSGWNSAWGLLKDVDLITNKGGVYLFSTIADKTKDWIQALEKLARKGVGNRIGEGFGQIEVCSEFHTVFREDAV